MESTCALHMESPSVGTPGQISGNPWVNGPTMGLKKKKGNHLGYLTAKSCG